MKKLTASLSSTLTIDFIDPEVIPVKVAEALKIDFGAVISGYLICAAVEGPCLIGIVFCDRDGRFENGHSIRTSSVVKQKIIKGYVVIETLNSRYVICDWSNEEAGPRFTGVRH